MFYGPKIGLVSFAIVLYMATAFVRNMTWQDNVLLYEDVLAKGTNRARVHNNLGSAYAAAANVEKALEHYQSALQLKPDYAEAHTNLGLVLCGIGQVDRGREELGIALQIEPDNKKARMFLSFYSRTAQ